MGNWSYPDKVDSRILPMDVLLNDSPLMSRSQPYPPEYRQQILDLHRGGRTIASLAREFEPCEQTIRNWKKQGDLDAGRRTDGPTTSAQEEITELRRRLRRVEQERDILAKATAWFAQETTETPDGSSRS